MGDMMYDGAYIKSTSSQGGVIGPCVGSGFARQGSVFARLEHALCWPLCRGLCGRFAGGWK